MGWAEVPSATSCPSMLREPRGKEGPKHAPEPLTTTPGAMVRRAPDATATVEIGRASCRERGKITGAEVALKEKNPERTATPVIVHVTVLPVNVRRNPVYKLNVG